VLSSIGDMLFYGGTSSDAGPKEKKARDQRAALRTHRVESRTANDAGEVEAVLDLSVKAN